MINGNDQCVYCGGLRVARSDMCADCLVEMCKTRLLEIERLEKEKIVLNDKLRQALRLDERLLDHISREAVYILDLRLELWRAKEITRRG